MSIAASFTWMATVAAGPVLLVIWIIEYDHEFQSATATRLPVPVISAYGLLGIRFGAVRRAWRWAGVTGHLPGRPVPENSGVALGGRAVGGSDVRLVPLLGSGQRSSGGLVSVAVLGQPMAVSPGRGRRSSQGV